MKSGEDVGQTQWTSVGKKGSQPLYEQKRKPSTEVFTYFRSWSCRMEGESLNLSELRGINSTTWDPCDKTEHKIQKESKSFYCSDPLLHNKLFQTEGYKKK